MAEAFRLDDQIHHRRDAHCPSCTEGYPRPCTCGGLIHAVPEPEEIDVVSITRCDRCGRSEDDLAEGQVA